MSAPRQPPKTAEEFEAERRLRIGAAAVPIADTLCVLLGRAAYVLPPATMDAVGAALEALAAELRWYAPRRG